MSKKQETKSPRPTFKSLLEIREYEHKGVKVWLKIDRRTSGVSLVNYDGSDKKWEFAKRGLEYQTGWKNILEAMSLAMDEGRIELELDLADRSKFTEKVLENIGKHTPWK